MREKRYIKAQNYINIQGWMVSELELKGNQLLIFACIYGFCQDDENWFEGSRAYLAEWCSIDVKNVTQNLKQLCEKGLLLKEEYQVNRVHMCRYKVDMDKIVSLLESDQTDEIEETQKNTPLQTGQEHEMSDNKERPTEPADELSDNTARVGVGMFRPYPPQSISGEDIKHPSSLRNVPETSTKFPSSVRNISGVGTKHPYPLRNIPGVGTKHPRGRYETPPNNKRDKKKDNKINPSLPFSFQKDLNSVPKKGTEGKGKENQAQQDVLSLQTRYILLERVVKGLIRYEDLVIQYPDQMQLLDSIVALIVDVRLSNRKKIRVACEDKVADVVKGQFAKLTFENIEQVILNLEKNTTEIKNIKQYMITSLYNSVFTKDYQNKAEINHLLNQYESATEE